MSVWMVLPDPTSVTALKTLQFLQTLGTFLLPSLLAVCLWSDTPFHWLRLHKGTDMKTAFFAICLMLCAVPGINLISLINQQIVLPSALKAIEDWMQSQEEAANLLTEQFLQVQSIGGLIENIGLMALLPAIGEELCFRGVLQSLIAPRIYSEVPRPLYSYPPSVLSKRISARIHIAIWITAAIFSFIHFQFYGFIPRMLMGAMFGYMVVWTGSLWIPMIMHFTNNALAVVSYYCIYNYQLDADWVDSFGTGDTLWIGLASLIIVSMGMVGFCLFTKKSQAQSPSEDFNNPRC